MPGYVPPHLRPGYVAPAPKPKRRGVHYVSNVSGHEENNVKVRRIKLNHHPRSLTRAEKAAAQSRLLSRRVVKPHAQRKPALKTAKAKAKAKRNTHSANPSKNRRITRKAKSY
jgi:hypothetical protein